MILETAFNTLRKCDLTSNQYEFSRHWCGMGRTYLSWVKAAKARPSHKALMQLVFNIDDKIAELSDDSEAEFPEVVAHDCAMLSTVRDDVMRFLRSSSLSPEQTEQL